MKKPLLWKIILSGSLIFFVMNSLTFAKINLGEIQQGSYQLISITNHKPEVIKKGKDYWDTLQKVQLEIGNIKQFKDIPKLASKTPYTGVISFGDIPQKVGLIIDIAGEEKRLYIDTNGDGSLADESWTPLLNEWLGIENYWVTGPEPIRVMVGYKSNPAMNHPLEISVEGFLLRPGTFSKEKPYVLISIRTWFLTKIKEAETEKYMAVCDRNNNGRFNDPEDQLLIDYNDDGFFSKEEVIWRQKGIKLKSGKQELTVDWDVYPSQLVIGGKIK